MMTRIVAMLGKQLFFVRLSDDSDGLFELPRDHEKKLGCTIGKPVEYRSDGQLIAYEAKIMSSSKVSKKRFGRPGIVRAGRDVLYRLVSAGNVLGLSGLAKRTKRLRFTDETISIIRALYDAERLVGPRDVDEADALIEEE